MFNNDWQGLNKRGPADNVISVPLILIRDQSHVKLTATGYLIMLDYPAAPVQAVSTLGSCGTEISEDDKVYQDLIHVKLLALH